MSSSAGLPPEDPWQIAKARFIRDLDPQEQELFNHATLENLFYTTSNTNREDAESSKVRSATRKLGPLVAAIENYGKALDVYSSIAPMYIAPFWGSIRVVLVLAKAHGRFFDRIVDTFERIGDILPRFRDYERIYDKAKHQRLTQALSNAYLEIIDFCMRTRDAIRQQKTSSVRRLFKPLSLDREFDEAVARFRQHKENVMEEARTCHMIEAAEERKAQLVLRTAERRAKALARLSPVDCTKRHRKLAASRHEGTGVWFTASKSYLDWDSITSSAVLCCHGIPGSGKSVLASSVIDSLRSDRAKCFYYLDYTDKRSLEPNNIFGTLTHQVLDKIDPLPETLLVAIEQAEHDGGQIIDFQKALGFFKSALDLVSCGNESIRIIFDGLDETDEKSQETITQSLKQLLESTKFPVKLIITGREDLCHIFPTSSTCSIVSIPMSPDAVALDIGAFVQDSVRRLIANGSIVIQDPNLEQQIVEGLAKGAKGMFLWVEFQLQDLSQQETDLGIIHALQNLPQSLVATYARLLGRIQRAERRLMIERMFKWLVAARQPLHVDELREGIAFTLEDDAWDPRKIPTDFKRLVRACGNLVVVDAESQIVTLAHYTVQQYLLQSQQGDFQFSMAEANEMAAETCVAYLNFSNYDTQLVRFKENANTDLVSMQRVAGKGHLLSPDNPGQNLMSIWNAFRNRKGPLPVVDMGQYLSKLPYEVTPTAFSLLPYVASHWLWHTRELEHPGTQQNENDRLTRRDTLFKELVLKKQLPFEFRPWPSGEHLPSSIMLAAILGWAIMSNHSYLIEIAFYDQSVNAFTLIQQGWSEIRFEESDYPQLSPEENTLQNWVLHRQPIFCVLPFRGFEGNATIATRRKIQDSAELSIDAFCRTPVSPPAWLHLRLLQCCRNGDVTTVQTCLKSMNNSYAALRQSLLIEAAASGNLSVVRFLYKVWSDSGPFRVKMGGFSLTAIDLAALGGHIATVAFFVSKGHQVDRTFYQHVLLESTRDNIEQILTLLRLRIAD